MEMLDTEVNIYIYFELIDNIALMFVTLVSFFSIFLDVFADHS